MPARPRPRLSISQALLVTSSRHSSPEETGTRLRRAPLVHRYVVWVHSGPAQQFPLEDRALGS
jgi:hypothetical protein